MPRTGSSIAVGLSALALTVALLGRPSVPTATAAEQADAIGEPRIAVCASIRLVNELMNSDRFKPAQTEERNRLQAEIVPIVDQGVALETRLKDIDPSSQEGQEIQHELMRLRQELARKQQETGIRFEQFISEQSREAYALIRDSAIAIAEKRGFNYVLASQNLDDNITEGPVAGVLNDILGRPVLLAPEGADITEEVRADLKLD